MKYKTTSVASTPEILKRHTGAELIVPVTIAAGAFTNGVCKAGTPIGADGTVKNTSAVKGILLNDVYDEDPNGSLIIAFASINVANAQKNSGVTLDAAVKTALNKIVFE